MLLSNLKFRLPAGRRAIPVILEGVETEAQRKALQTLECTTVLST